MELIKKTILQAITTGKTITGGTIIIPDLTKVYFLKLLLSQEGKDLGFFDAYVEEVEPPVPPVPVPPVPPVPVETFYYVDTDGAVFINTNGDKFIWT